MGQKIPSIKYQGSVDDFAYMEEINDRRYEIYETIEPIAEGDDSSTGSKPLIPWLIEQIIQCNREDKGLPIDQRKPIRLYINSPGGDLFAGFGLIDAIKLSKTPVYTINVGQWCSMAFLIGISGHKRYSLPHVKFLMHDGHSFTYGSTAKAQDEAEFNKRYEKEVVKAHVLENSNMTSQEYDKVFRIEYYMLPKDALEKNFIDEIVTDLEAIM